MTVEERGLVKAYFRKGKVFIRDAQSGDVEKLAPRLRKTDVDEVWAGGHYRPLEALRFSFERAFMCLTVVRGTQIIGMGGINPYSILGDKAVIWFLASDEVNKIKTTFGIISRLCVKKFLYYYPILDNFVHARNITSLRWLQWLGAEIGEPVPFGPEGELFRYFVFRR